MSEVLTENNCYNWLVLLRDILPKEKQRYKLRNWLYDRQAYAKKKYIDVNKLIWNRYINERYITEEYK